MQNEEKIQREYYAETAKKYDQFHGGSSEHDFAFNIMLAAIDLYNFTSVLEIGSGTGRILTKLKIARPHLRVIGIEPSTELRDAGYTKGVSRSDLIDGDGYKLNFGDHSFDLVCEFAVLHHVREPAKVVAEMLRVAKSAVFISDSNNFGQGGKMLRTIKQLINMVKLWPVANWFKTKGKGYSISEGDGLAYSYSVFDNYKQIQVACDRVHVINTGPSSGINPYRHSEHAALLGLKSR